MAIENDLMDFLSSISVHSKERFLKVNVGALKALPEWHEAAHRTLLILHPTLSHDL